MIPDEAVEAAAEALCRAVWNTTWDMVHENQRHVFREDARKALEAAAPHMIAAAWDAAIAEADARHMIGGSDADELKDANPYRV